MYIIYVNHDSVIKQICQLRDKAFLINETASQFHVQQHRPPERTEGCRDPWVYGH